MALKQFLIDNFFQTSYILDVASVGDKARQDVLMKFGSTNPAISGLHLSWFPKLWG